MSDWAVDRLLLRDRWIVGGCVAAIAVLAWLWLWREWAAMAPDTSMPGMEMPSAAMASPSDAAAYLASAFVMWFLMMIAMMLPSATPMIMLYGGLARGARDGASGLGPDVDFRRRVPGRLGRFLGPGGFSSMAACAVGRGLRNQPRIWQSARLRRSPDRGRPLSGDAAQASMSAELPFPDVVSDAVLATGLGRRSTPGSHPRDLLSRLLRIVDGAAVRFRGHEPCLGRRTGAAGSRGKGLARRAAGWRRSRRGRHSPWAPYGCRRKVADLSGGRRKLEQSCFERPSTFASSVGQNPKGAARLEIETPSRPVGFLTRLRRHLGKTAFCTSHTFVGPILYGSKGSACAGHHVVRE